MLYSYFVFIFTMLGLQCAVVGYGAAHGGTIESTAGKVVKQVGTYSRFRTVFGSDINYIAAERTHCSHGLKAVAVRQIWGKSCECVDGPECLPSQVECFTKKPLFVPPSSLRVLSKSLKTTSMLISDAESLKDTRVHHALHENLHSIAAWCFAIIIMIHKSFDEKSFR